MRRLGINCPQPRMKYDDISMLVTVQDSVSRSHSRVTTSGLGAEHHLGPTERLENYLPSGPQIGLGILREIA